MPRDGHKNAATTHGAASAKSSSFWKNDAAPGTAIDANSEWVRLPKAGFTLRGFSRSFLYQLCEAGTVQSIVIQGPPLRGRDGKPRTRKTSRGCRLLHLPSLDAYLAEQLREQTAAMKPKEAK